MISVDDLNRWEEWASATTKRLYEQHLGMVRVGNLAEASHTAAQLTVASVQLLVTRIRKEV